MKNEFEEIENGLKLLKEEGEKNIKNVSFVNKFIDSIEKERVFFSNFKLKQILIYLIIILLSSNLFLIKKLTLQNKKLVLLSGKNTENQPLIIEKEKIGIKEIKKQNLIEKKSSKKIIEEQKPEEEFVVSEVLRLEETIKFTEEINKIIGLFIINLNMEGKNVES